jgi:hypothetical protein
MDPSGAILLGEPGQFRLGPSPPKSQSRAERPEALVKALEAAMEPPALRSPDPPASGRFVVQYIDGNHCPFPSRRFQRRLVVEPEILPEPQEGGGRHAEVFSGDGSAIGKVHVLVHPLDRVQADIMMLSVGRVLPGELDPVAFDPVDGPDPSSVRGPNLHVRPDAGSFRHSDLLFIR